MAEVIIAALILLMTVWLLVLMHRISDTLERTVDAADQRIDRLKDDVIEGRRHTERSDVREQNDRAAIDVIQERLRVRPRRRSDRSSDRDP